MGTVDHTIKLQSEPFNKIKNGTKTIESRLFDGKRRNIKIGDIIEFQCSSDLKETVKVVYGGE